jgi:hypothetical protein
VTDAPRPTLAETGHVYVTLSAARTYADHERLKDEEARRELTELLLDARRVEQGEQPGGPQLWRMRRRSTGLDLTARIAVQGRLHVVVAVSVREGNSSGGAGRRG